MFIKRIVVILLLLVAYVPCIAGTAENILYMAQYDNRYPATYIGWLFANPEPYKTTSFDYTMSYYSSDLSFSAVAADYHTGNVTFHDTLNHRIYFSDSIVEFGGIAHTIAGGTSGRVDALTIDWLAQNVYWVDEGYNWIKMTTYVGGGEVALIVDTGLERPSGIACHPLKGYLFWTELGDIDPARIERSSMTGKDRTTIVSTSLSAPTSITVDIITNRIYWTDNSESESKIESSDLNGEVRRTEVLQLSSLGTFDSIAVDEDYIFVSVVATFENRIRYYNKTTPNELVFEHNFGDVIRVFDICVTGANVQPRLMTLPCDGHTCEHFCVSAAGGSHECICRDNYALIPDGNCTIDLNLLQPPFYVIGTTNGISTFDPSLLHYDLEYKQQYIADILSGYEVIGLTVDIRSNLLFYADISRKTIYSIKMKGGQYPSETRSGIGQVDGMAVDWITRNVYWVDYEKGRLEMSSYDGSSWNVLFYDVTKPKAIAVDPNDRLIFWTEEASPAKLVRCDLDGENRRDLIETTLQNPSGIALDYARKWIYIVGTDDTLIYMIDYDGNEQTAIGRSLHPASDITIYQDFIILAETYMVTEAIVEAIHKESGEHEGKLTVDSSVCAIDIADESAQPIYLVTTLAVTTGVIPTLSAHETSVIPTESENGSGVIPTLSAHETSVIPTESDNEPGISLIIIGAAVGGVVVFILLILGIIIKCKKRPKATSNPHTVSRPNIYVTDIQGNVDQGNTGTIYEELPELKSSYPPTYESSIGARGGNLVIEESPYLRAKFDHQVQFQNNNAHYFRPEQNQLHASSHVNLPPPDYDPAGYYIDLRF